MANLKNRTPERVQSFNRGQFSGFEPTMVPDGGVSEAKNVIIAELGRAKQRGGLTRTGDNPDAKVSHWTFDASDSTDDKGSNDGTDTDITYSDGKFGKGAEFNGTTSKIVVSADTSIDVNSMGTFTISTQVYIDNDGKNDVGRIVDKSDSRTSPTVGYVLNVQNESSSTVKVRFFVDHATTNAEVITSTTISTGAWHKIDAVYQSDKSLDIYLDGALASYGTDTTGVGTVSDDSSQDLVIGNVTDSSATFDGIIDDIRIYDTARTAAQIAQDKIQGVHRFRVGTTIDRIYRIINTSLQRLNTDFKDWTDIDTGFTADKETNFVTGRASDGTYRMFIFNGTDNVHSMNTSETITDEGNTNTDPPKSQQGEWHDNRLFVIDNNGDINYSDVLDGQTFDRIAQIFHTRTPAKAIKSFKEKELIIYNVKGIQVLNTTGANPLNDWELNIFNENIEFNSPRSIQNVGDDQIFLARDGVRLLSRTQFDKIESGIISQPIQDIIDTINQDYIQKACSWFIDNKYILAIPTQSNTENDTVIIWDALAAKISGDITNGWTIIPSGDWNPAVFSEMDFGDGVLTLLMGDNRDISNVYKALSGNTDIGKTITSEIISKEHTIDAVTDAIWDPTHAVCQSGVSTTVTIQGEVERGGFLDLGTLDLDTNSPVLPIALSFNLGGSGTVKGLLRSKFLERGKTYRVKFKHNTYNKQPTFLEYTVFARALSPRFT